MLLTFDDELGPRHFDFVFVGFILGGSLQEKKGLSVLRAELALLDKLESISELRPCGKKLVNGEPDRRLKNGDESKHLDLTPDEYGLLSRYVAQVPWQTGQPTRGALDTIDWLARHAERYPLPVGIQ